MLPSERTGFINKIKQLQEEKKEIYAAACRQVAYRIRYSKEIPEEMKDMLIALVWANYGNKENV